jgi:hypothetical protein
VPARRVARKQKMITIMAIDPGSTSGAACATLPLRRGLAWPALESCEMESWDVSGPIGAQAQAIMRQARLLDAKHWSFLLVFESFQMRTGENESRRSELLDPVRVIAGCDALAHTDTGQRWIKFQMQQASSKTFANNERLRSHGLWARGSSEHRRDAIRHVCKAYADIAANYAE